MPEISATQFLKDIKSSIPDIQKLPLTPEIKRIDRTFDTIIEQLPYTVLKIGLGMAIIILAWIVSGWLGTRLNRWLVKAHVEETLAAFLASVGRFTFFFAFFPLGLTTIGVSSGSIAALLGAMGLAVGFAIRNTIGGVAGGLMMMVHRPMRVGDWIEYMNPGNNVVGTVKRIGLFSTEINTPEHIRVFVPNYVLWENVLRNHTYNRMRMVSVGFPLALDTDTRAALDVVKAAMVAHPLVLKAPEPLTTVEMINEHGIHCTVEVWTRTEDRRTLRQTLLLDVLEALKAAGVKLAHEDDGKHDTAPKASHT